jgi:hypothetical protein
MIISKKEINGLMRLIGLTRDEEIDCNQCLMRVSEFAEQELDGKTIPDSLKAVEHHLSVCSECCEEYEILKLALKKMSN